MELTPMQVIFNGVDLGGTLGNVQVHPKIATSALKADQLGSTSLDWRVSGYDISITTNLAETNLMDNWKVIFPYAKLISSGGNKAMYWDTQIGDSALTHAAQLKLHPLSKQSTDLSQDYLFYKAIASADSQIDFSPTKQSQMKIVWHVLPDTSVSPARFFFHGDPAVGLVNASAGSPAFTGTGNGTITSVVVNNGVTKTETITVSCVGASSGNNFDVSGSVSGPLGGFHIASAAASTYNFVSGPISFLMTQGSTQFVYGDSFTIATTAANYA